MSDREDVPIPSEAHPLVDGRNVGQVVTLMADGSPQVTPVWVGREDGTLTFNTATGRLKTRNLQRDPRVAVNVVDSEDPWHYLQVRGVAELTEEGANAHVDALSRKYLGKPYTRFREDQRRIMVRVRAHAVTYHPSRTPPPPGASEG